jgi:hypothetical protein
LHQLAGDIVDGRDVIGIDGMAQAERVGKHRRAEQDRLRMKYRVRPNLDQDVGADEQRIEAGDSAAQIRAAVIDDIGEHPKHG